MLYPRPSAQNHWGHRAWTLFSLCAHSLFWQAVLSQGWFVPQEHVAKSEGIVVCQIVRCSAGWW